MYYKEIDHALLIGVQRDFSLHFFGVIIDFKGFFSHTPEYSFVLSLLLTMMYTEVVERKEMHHIAIHMYQRFRSQHLLISVEMFILGHFWGTTTW